MAEPRHEFEVAFDEAFVRAALRRDFRDKGLIGVGFLAAVLAGCWWWLGTFPAMPAVVVAVALPLLALRLHFALRTAARRVVALWRKQAPSGRMLWRLDDEGFEVVLEEARARYAWSGLRRLWRYRDVWIVEIVKNTSTFLPPDAVPEDARGLIVEPCRAAGVRV